MKKFIPLFVLFGILFLGAGIYIIIARLGMPLRSGENDTPAGFFWGLWQGAIIFFSFVASWFDGNVTLYENNNNGFWYNLGYFIGIAIAVGGSAKGSNTKKSQIKFSAKEAEIEIKETE